MSRAIGSSGQARVKSPYLDHSLDRWMILVPGVRWYLVRAIF